MGGGVAVHTQIWTHALSQQWTKHEKAHNHMTCSMDNYDLGGSNVKGGKNSFKFDCACLGWVFNVVYELTPLQERDFSNLLFSHFYIPQLPTVLRCFHISEKLWIMYTIIQMTLCTPEEINYSFHYHISQITFSHKSVYIQKNGNIICSSAVLPYQPAKRRNNN